MMKSKDGWKTVTLGEIFEFEKKSKIKAGEGLKEGKYKFFTSSDTQSKFLNEYIFEGEYLIFATGGHAGIHYCDEKFATSTDCFVVKAKDKILSKYIYYFLYGNIGLLEAGFKGAGLRHISKGYIQNIRIPYPESKETQKHIVSLLEKAELAKNLRKDADELTKDYLKSVFMEMFGDPLTNPKKWEVKPLIEFGLIKTGNTPSRSKPEYYGNYIDWIKSDNINTPFTFLTKGEEGLSEEGAKVGRIVPKKSVLVTCIAGSLSCIGNVAIADRKVAFNQQINAIIPNNTVNEYFLYFLILNTKKHIQNSSTQSMKGMVSKSVFEKVRYIHPPIELQLKFAKIVEKVEKLKQYQKESKKQTDGLFNALMQKAFRGELL
ncbi:MAG: restriction endonuclease subunit S [Candidatus Woesearchaeota archaeon]